MSNFLLFALFCCCIPVFSVGIPGGLFDADENDAAIRDLAEKAVKLIEESRASKSILKLLELKDVKSQVVNGILYHMTVSLGPTSCPTSNEYLNGCHIESDKVELCKLKLYQPPLMSEQQAEISIKFPVECVQQKGGKKNLLGEEDQEEDEAAGNSLTQFAVGQMNIHSRPLKPKRNKRFIAVSNLGRPKTLVGDDKHDIGYKYLGADKHGIGYKQLGADKHDIGYKQLGADKQDIDYKQLGADKHDIGYKQLGADKHDIGYKHLGADKHDIGYKQLGADKHDIGYKQLGADKHDIGYKNLGADKHDIGYKQLGADKHDIGYKQHGADKHGIGYKQLGADKHDIGYKQLGSDKHHIGYKQLGPEKHDIGYKQLGTDNHDIGYKKPRTDTHDFDYKKLLMNFGAFKRDDVGLKAIMADWKEMGNFGAFRSFQAKYNKTYETTKEMEYRFSVFRKNMQKAAYLNANEQGPSDIRARYGATVFADMTEEEFKRHYRNPQWDLRLKPEVDADIPDLQDVPVSFDWRNYNAVTEVRNQGMCGSCWAFSTVGNIEGQWSIKKKSLVELSEQELLDCDKVDQACNGGLPSQAYKEIMRIGGLETESQYPYDGRREKCKFSSSKNKAFINGSIAISRDENEMAAWLAKNGPISIGINANVMQFYFGGISHPFSFLCGKNNLDHGVLIVGYGVKKSIWGKKLPYWIIKNSWGKHWGKAGYYYVYRGDGTCGLNQMCTSAVVK